MILNVCNDDSSQTQILKASIKVEALTAELPTGVVNVVPKVPVTNSDGTVRMKSGDVQTTLIDMINTMMYVDGGFPDAPPNVLA